MGCGASTTALPADAASPSDDLPAIASVVVAENKQPATRGPKHAGFDVHTDGNSGGEAPGMAPPGAKRALAGSPDMDEGIGVAVDGMEVMGQEGDPESPPLMRRTTTKKRSEPRMVRDMDIPTIDTGSARFDSARLAEIAAAKEKANQAQLLEQRSIRLAEKLAAEDDEDEEENGSLTLESLGIRPSAVPGRISNDSPSAGPSATTLPALSGAASSGVPGVPRSKIADVVGSADAVNIGSGHFGEPDPALGDMSGSFRMSPNMLGLQSNGALTDSNDFSRLAPPSLGGVAAPAASRLAGQASARPCRYTDISLSDSDDDSGGGFDLPRWCKFFTWNRNKHADLLEFLWRRFDPKTNSMFVLTYMAQDALFAAYQGDNVMHGMACRLEEHLDNQMDLFGILHTYMNPETGAYKVLGLLITDGTDVPPQLRAMSDFADWRWAKVDSHNPTIRKFVGSMVVAESPVPELAVMFTRDLRLQRNKWTQ